MISDQEQPSNDQIILLKERKRIVDKLKTLFKIDYAEGLAMQLGIKERELNE